MYGILQSDDRKQTVIGFYGKRTGVTMENHIQILIFAGTTEGRMLAQYASQHEIGCYVSTATEYGKSILEGLEGVDCISGRMDQKEMETFISGHGIRLVIDATHPYAVEVSQRIQNACQKTDAL